MSHDRAQQFYRELKVLPKIPNFIRLLNGQKQAKSVKFFAAKKTISTWTYCLAKMKILRSIKLCAKSAKFLELEDELISKELRIKASSVFLLCLITGSKINSHQS